MFTYYDKQKVTFQNQFREVCRITQKKAQSGGLVAAFWIQPNRGLLALKSRDKQGCCFLQFMGSHRTGLYLK